MALGAFDEAAASGAGSGADEGDEVGCVHGPPPLSGGLDELEDHGECGGAGAGASGDLGPQAHGGEHGLDRIRGPHVDPVLGWEAGERQQLVADFGMESICPGR